MRVLGFPGQGAQHTGMGADLFARYPRLVARADTLLGYSVAGLCQAEAAVLARTEHSQVALYVVGALGYRRFLDDGGDPPDVVVGHSVGEYAALYAAGVVDFETGLRLVAHRGQLMAGADGGAMAALLGPDLGEVERLLAAHGLDALDVALHNAPGQHAVAGPAAEIDRLVDLAAAADVRCVRLNVSGPFHSRYMAPAATRFAGFLVGAHFRDPRVEVVANASAAPLAAGADAAGLLVEQMVSPVRWRQSIELLLDRAGPDGLDFTEIGPGTTLTGLVRRIVRAAAVPAAPAVPVPRARPPHESGVTL